MENVYRCGICGKEFTTIEMRNECERRCIASKKEADRKAADEKKAAEKMARKSEVDAAFDKAYKLRDEYIKDYNYYMYEDTGTIHLPFDNKDFSKPEWWSWSW